MMQTMKCVFNTLFFPSALMRSTNSPLLNELELLARIASAGANFSKSWNVDNLISNFSGTASTTSQASLTASPRSSSASHFPGLRRVRAVKAPMLVVM